MFTLIFRVDSSDNQTLKYTAKTNEENVSEHFLKTLVDLVKKIGNKYAADKPLALTEKERFEFDNTTICWICKERFNDDASRKVRDHCHYTGKYRGPAHSLCNLKLRKDKVITVGFHNGTNYDFHLFVKSLGRVDGKIRVIAKNSEKYISVTKPICVGECEELDKNGKPVLDKNGKPIVRKDMWHLRFIDTCGIVRDKLRNLVKNYREINLKY